MFLDTINKRLVDLQKQKKPNEEPVQVMSTESELPAGVTTIRTPAFRPVFDAEEAKKKVKRAKRKVSSQVVDIPAPVLKEITEPEELKAINEDIRLHKVDNIDTVTSAAKPSSVEVSKPRENLQADALAVGETRSGSGQAAESLIKAHKPIEKKAEATHIEAVSAAPVVFEPKPQPKPKTKSVASTLSKNEKSVEKPIFVPDKNRQTKITAVRLPLDLHKEMSSLVALMKGVPDTPQSLQALALYCTAEGFKVVSQALRVKVRKHKAAKKQKSAV